MSNKLPWMLAEWHNISTSAAPLKIDGVLFQDIKSVLDVIARMPQGQAWATSVISAYNHVSTFEINLHLDNPDAFETKVIELIYEVWRQEGYTGSLDFFTKLFFIYIEIVNYATALENADSLVLVPSVETVAMAIKVHDEDLDAHEDLLRSIFKGMPPNVFPCASYFQYTLGEVELASYYNSKTKTYENVPIFGDDPILNDTCTLICCVRYLEAQKVFGIRGQNPQIHYYVEIVPENNLVKLVSDDGTTVKNLVMLSVANFETSYYPPDKQMAIALIFQCGSVTLAVNGDSGEYTFPGTLAGSTELPIQIDWRGPKQPVGWFSRMEKNDPLQSFVVYREAMSPNQLDYLFALYQYPIIQTR